MIRSELVDRIAVMNPHLFAKEVEAVVDAILGRIEAALVAKNRIEIRGFGAFSVVEAAARPARNPRTGQAVDVKAKNKVYFKPGKTMRQRVNRE